jgi:hypothetical protein
MQDVADWLDTDEGQCWLNNNHMPVLYRQHGAFGEVKEDLVEAHELAYPHMWENEGHTWTTTKTLLSGRDCFVKCPDDCFENATPEHQAELIYYFYYMPPAQPPLAQVPPGIVLLGREFWETLSDNIPEHP